MTEMWVNMGPQHPMTHGLWSLRVKLNGEIITDAEPMIGYLHPWLGENDETGTIIRSSRFPIVSAMRRHYPGLTYTAERSRN